jgi:CSLREA domain-containing protein
MSHRGRFVMKTRCARVLAVLFAFLLFALGAQAVLGAGAGVLDELVVDTLVDENDHFCNDGDCSLRDAIELAASGDTINFAVTGTIELEWSGQLLVDKDLTILGPGVENLTIHGDEHRVFYISPGVAVTITGLTIEGGYKDGAAAYNEGMLHLSDCLVERNYGDPGALLNHGGTLVVANCTLSDNAGTGGGGIANRSGGVVTVTSSIIVGNGTDGGGGVANYSGTLTVRNTLFADNKAYGYGGGLYNQGVATLDACSFVGNVAERDGGGIKNDGGTLSLTNSTLYDNATEWPGSTGGGIDDSDDGVVSLVNCTVFSNTNYGLATSGSGGDPTMTAVNTIVAGNSAADCSGGFTGGSSHNQATDSSCGPGFTQVSPSDLALGDLAGHPPYIPLLEGSVAIDAGTNTGCPATDQRGVPRPQDPYETGTPICDVGSYEVLSFGGIYLPLVLMGGT